jgi:transcriptional adapter 2-alpha
VYADLKTTLELKLAILDIYNSKLDKRADRKQFIFDRGFLEFKKVELTLLGSL